MVKPCSCWTWICLAFANTVNSDANWSGSALFVIKYENLYSQPESSNLIGWQLEEGVVPVWCFVINLFLSLMLCNYNLFHTDQTQQIDDIYVLPQPSPLHLNRATKLQSWREHIV